MNFRKTILLVISLGMIAALVGCSSSFKQPITVAITTPPANMNQGQITSITATVLSDPTNAGVTWSCSATDAATGTTLSACGTFSSSTSASGTPVTYTALTDTALTQGANVTITATSVANTSVSASASVTVNDQITVGLSTVPSSLYVNDYISVTATVANDAINAGVNWSCSGATSCGKFSLANPVPSGTAVTYTAPASSASIAITATSVANTAISASAKITVNPTSGITVTWTTPPPASLPTGGTAFIVVTTTDPVGLNFSCTPASSCGLFSPANPVPSGTTVTYTAPVTTGSVTIIADSNSDDAISASSSVTITTSVVTTLANGNYVFSMSGWDSTAANGNDPYFYAGAFTVASGAITTGEQDFSDPYHQVAAEAITGGTITATADGNLLITLTPASSETYINGGSPVVLDVSMVSATKGLLTEYDNFATSSGELNLQAAPLAAPAGGYAIAISGLDSKTTAPVALGGVVNVDGSGTISGAGSVFDLNEDGTLNPDWLLTSSVSTVTGPDTFGLVTFTLVPSAASAVPEIILDGYMVDANHIRLVENWGAEHALSPEGLLGITGGTAYAQTGTGTFSNSLISGNSYVISATGADRASVVDQVAGVLTFNSNGSVSGNVSFNDGSTTNPAQGGAAITGGTYTIDASGTGNDGGTGRVTVTGLTDGKTFTYNLELYLDGNGHATVISLDTGDVLAGESRQQASGLNASSLSGQYGMGLAQFTEGYPYNSAGAFIANGLSSLSGFLDQNWWAVAEGQQEADQPISEAYAATSTNGVLTITPSSDNGTLFTGYQIDTTQGVVIENDLSGLTLGYFANE